MLTNGSKMIHISCHGYIKNKIFRLLIESSIPEKEGISVEFTKSDLNTLIKGCDISHI